MPRVFLVFPFIKQLEIHVYIYIFPESKQAHITIQNQHAIIHLPSISMRVHKNKYYDEKDLISCYYNNSLIFMQQTHIYNMHPWKENTCKVPHILSKFKNSYAWKVYHSHKLNHPSKLPPQGS